MIVNVLIYICIQLEFNQVTYSMVTDTTAASLFRLEPTSGRITLISSLTADDAPRYLVCCVSILALLNILSKLSSNSSIIETLHVCLKLKKIDWSFDFQ